MIIRQLKQILFFDEESKNLLFKVDCIGGRAKWKDSTNLLSLKFQVSSKVEETVELNELKAGKAYFKCEIIGSENFEAFTKMGFSDFTVTKLELRSFTMSTNKNVDSFLTYFIEGKATNLVSAVIDKYVN